MPTSTVPTDEKTNRKLVLNLLGKFLKLFACKAAILNPRLTVSSRVSTLISPPLVLKWSPDSPLHNEVSRMEGPTASVSVRHSQLIRLHGEDDETIPLASMHCQMVTRSQMEALIASNQDLMIYSWRGVIMEARSAPLPLLTSVGIP